MFTSMVAVVSHLKSLMQQAEDVDVDGLPKSASRSKYDLDGGGGQVSLLIRVSHKVGCCPPSV